MGIGTWSIGGPFWRGTQPVGWGQVDDAESIRAIRRALDLGITFVDTSDVYGCGHSERVLGEALDGVRDQVVLATKCGNVFDEETQQITGSDASPEYIRRACEASLRRLRTDTIDLYQFHLASYDPEEAAVVRDVLEDLVAEGKIRTYGWSTDRLDRARVFAQGEHCAVIQQRLNLFEGNHEILAMCEELDLASVNRTPLSKGLLTGKFSTQSPAMPSDDVRHGWSFSEGNLAEWLKALEALRQILTRDGRSLAQAALGWIWAKSERTIPIPGFKTVDQIKEIAGAMAFGPLSAEQMDEIEAWIG